MNKMLFGLLLTLAASLVVYAAAPDLVANARSVEHSVYVGVPSQIQVVTSNIGNAPTGSGSVTSIMLNNYTYFVNVSILNASGWQYDYFTFTCPAAGRYPVYLYADRYNSVNESNETNNYGYATWGIECYNPPAKCYLGLIPDPFGPVAPGGQATVYLGLKDAYGNVIYTPGGYPGPESAELSSNVGTVVNSGVPAFSTFTAQNYPGSGYIFADYQDGGHHVNCSINVTVACPCTAGCTCYGNMKVCTTCNCNMTNSTCQYGCKNGVCFTKEPIPTKPEIRPTMAAGVLGLGDAVDWLVVVLIIIAAALIYFVFMKKKK